jgi:hypothetical protein
LVVATAKFEEATQRVKFVLNARQNQAVQVLSYTDLALENGGSVHGPTGYGSVIRHVELISAIRVDRNSIVPVVVCGVETTLGRRLEASAIGIFLDVSGFIIYHCLYEGCKLFVGTK